MKTKPLSIKIISLIFLLAPLGNILQIAYFNHWPLSGPRGVLNHFSHYEWAILACFPIIAYGIWSVSRWGYWATVSFATFLIIHNTYAFFVNHAYSPYIVLLFQCVSFSIMGFFLQKHITAPYFNPKLRWWQNSPRYKVQLEAQARMEQTTFKCQILDVSMGGCFATVDKALILGDLLWIHLQVKDWQVVGLSKVVWVKEDPDKADKGYGLMFLSLEKKESDSLHKILKYLRDSQKNSVAQKDQNGDSMSA